ncbi:MAG: hypothetical protein H7A21_03210 [Spirochaetales bacterium]|nr:hypothetical protein [Leptospiraceae bacterium]MCP5480417.1 hypothetical protein [Spirochaetales bacterium]
MRRGALIASVFLVFVSCERLTTPPTPPGVPAGAQYERAIRLWTYQAASGESRTYFEQGQLAMRGHYVQGLKDGLWQSFSTDGDQITAEGRYNRGWHDGVWRYFDTRGQVYLTVEYKMEPRRADLLLLTTEIGNENGVYRRYYPDGSLEEEGHFWSGYFHGPFRHYHPNNRGLAIAGRFERDQKIGQWRYYYADGTLERVENYKDGVLDGVQQNYYPDGSLYHSSVYANGERLRLMEIRPLPGREGSDATRANDDA